MKKSLVQLVLKNHFSMALPKPETLVVSDRYPDLSLTAILLLLRTLSNKNLMALGKRQDLHSFFYSSYGYLNLTDKHGRPPGGTGLI